MATVHLIHGFLGAGKTSFARQLEATHSALRFSHDEWMVRLYGSDPPVESFPIYFERVSGLIQSIWPRCLELGLDVVLDLNFWVRTNRDVARRLAAGAGAECRLYRVSVADDVALERVARRNLEPGELHISPATFELLRGRFEPLGADEAVIEVG